jgi:hypothetical protein
MAKCKCGGWLTYLYSFIAHDKSTDSNLPIKVYLCKSCNHIVYKLEEELNG